MENIVLATDEKVRCVMQLMDASLIPCGNLDTVANAAKVYSYISYYKMLEINKTLRDVLVLRIFQEHGTLEHRDLMNIIVKMFTDRDLLSAISMSWKKIAQMLHLNVYMKPRMKRKPKSRARPDKWTDDFADILYDKETRELRSRLNDVIVT